MNNQKGAILYFTIVIMSILLAAVFSITSIVLVQIKGMKEVGDSVLAFYAADTGIETVLNDLYDGNYIDHYGPTSMGSADYEYEAWVTQPISGTLPVIPTSVDCEGQYYCIESIGTYRNVKRAIEVKG
jgi:hypothetical protein